MHIINIISETFKPFYTNQYREETKFTESLQLISIVHGNVIFNNQLNVRLKYEAYLM